MSGQLPAYRVFEGGVGGKLVDFLNGCLGLTAVEIREGEFKGEGNSPNPPYFHQSIISVKA